jgi:hypothetical protein
MDIFGEQTQFLLINFLEQNKLVTRFLADRLKRARGST